MALSYVTHVGDGVTTNFAVSFPYIASADVDVYLDGVLQVLATDWNWFNTSTVQFVVAPAGSAVVKIIRTTQDTTRLVDYQDAGNLTESDLDTDSNQLFYLVQEGLDNFNDNAMALDTDDKWEASSKIIKNVTDPTADQEAATKKYVDDNNASSNLAAALVAQTAAEAAQTAAEVAQTGAETAETNAETAETAAVVAQTAAEAAQTAAEAVYDDFDDRYLGVKASDPTLDNDGAALATGALYFNSTSGVMKVYNGASWDELIQGGLTQTTADTLYQPLDEELSDLAILPPTKGNIIVGNGTAWYFLGVGTNGQVVTADSAQAKGVKWATPVGLGINQTWQNVSTSRAVGTTYQNTTGAPIMVICTVQVQEAQNTYAYCEDDATPAIIVSEYESVSSNANVDNFRFTHSFVVPDNSYYKVVTGTEIRWTELR